MSQLLFHAEKRDAFGSAARNAVTERFNPEKMIHEYDEVMTAVLGR